MAEEPETVRNSPALVSAAELLGQNHQYLDSYYPLREVEWMSINNASISATTFGALIGTIASSFVVIAGKIFTKTDLPKHETYSLIITLCLFVISYGISLLVDKRKRATKRNINNHFSKKSSGGAA